MTDYPPILSFGAGVNSTALAILAINDGWRGEIVFSDTGCEWPETYCYLDYFEREWLAARGLHVTRLGPRYDPHPSGPSYSGASLIEYCERNHIVPMMAVRWCTVKWKVTPIDRWAAGRETMIGIAANEAHRQRGRCCPLVDADVDRAGCVQIIQHEVLNVPQKSGCYICPYQRSVQWRDLWQHHPDLYARAELMELNGQKRRSRGGTITLDPKGKITLAQRRRAFEAQLALPEIDMDELRAYQPCVCGL